LNYLKKRNELGLENKFQFVPLKGKFSLLLQSGRGGQSNKKKPSTEVVEGPSLTLVRNWEAGLGCGVLGKPEIHVYLANNYKLFYFIKYNNYEMK